MTQQGMLEQRLLVGLVEPCPRVTWPLLSSSRESPLPIQTSSMSLIKIYPNSSDQTVFCRYAHALFGTRHFTAYCKRPDTGCHINQATKTA